MREKIADMSSVISVSCATLAILGVDGCMEFGTGYLMDGILFVLAGVFGFIAYKEMKKNEW